MKKPIFPLLILFMFLPCLAFSNVTESPLLSIPVQVTLLTSEIEPEINADVSRYELEKMFETVNIIWQQAGIKFYIDTIISIPAANALEYKKALLKNSELTKKQRTQIVLKACHPAREKATRLTLCVVGKMANPFLAGVYFKKPNPLVAWPTKTKRGPNPATLAHEFGHALGLRHNTEADIYLMRGAGNNIRRIGQYADIKLTEKEVTSARQISVKYFQDKLSH